MKVISADPGVVALGDTETPKLKVKLPPAATGESLGVVTVTSGLLVNPAGVTVIGWVPLLATVTSTVPVAPTETLTVQAVLRLGSVSQVIEVKSPVPVTAVMLSGSPIVTVVVTVRDRKA